jgi:hypothetical protein
MEMQDTGKYESRMIRRIADDAAFLPVWQD